MSALITRHSSHATSAICQRTHTRVLHACVAPNIFRAGEHIDPPCEDFSLVRRNVLVRHYPYFKCTVNVDSLPPSPRLRRDRRAPSVGRKATYIPTGPNLFLSAFPKPLECLSLPLKKEMKNCELRMKNCRVQVQWYSQNKGNT